ncbi:MAG: hypothetical protein SPF22_07765 [Candidatus Onthovivens sp.]|nr:hypothetical protein [Candidatus Onthovivens sp.]
MPISFSALEYLVFATWNTPYDTSYVISIVRKSINSISSVSPSAVDNNVYIWYMAIGY